MKYDENNEKDIERYGKELENKSLKKLGIFEISKDIDKGGFNKIVEAKYFGIANNSSQEPDFKKVGVELKVTPLKRVKVEKESTVLRKRKGLSMKERTILTMIDYIKLSSETWEKNTLSAKAFKILFCFYIWEKGISNLDYIFDLVSLWKPSKKDLEIIKDDWKTILSKVKEGKAHEISEGDTLYLGACTKGTKSNNMRKQPYSDILAKQRAFSFKRNYMDIVYEELLQKKELNLISIKKVEKSLEETLEELFEPYIGKTAFELERFFDIKINEVEKKLPKNYYSMISNKILKVESLDKIEEFKKAGVLLKSIRVDKKGRPLEDISFPYFKFKELVEEDEWEDSELYDYLTSQKFLFVVFEIKTERKKEFNNYSSFEKRKYLELKKVKLWNIQESGLLEMEKVWNETKKVAIEGVQINIKGNRKFNNLPDKKFSSVGHVRPHGRDSNDVDILPNGKKITKQCFWLNAAYIQNQVVIEQEGTLKK